MTDSTSITSTSIKVVLLDVMDTLVKDPFFTVVPRFHEMEMTELAQQMNKEAWFAFERGEIDENEYKMQYFKDKRNVDLEGVKDCMKEGYAFIDGIENLLEELSNCNVKVCALSNYPVWWQMIEEKLQLSRFLEWQFMSCKMGLRKPEKDLYLKVAETLNVYEKECVFVDDRALNCDGARAAGMHAIHFKNADSLRSKLRELGILRENKLK